jgi:RHH-type proline utilization regulon transcriptional repressor/proline dehydrogenase/delta 1-pyrroline-5-carboxylate dehydrogenase
VSWGQVEIKYGASKSKKIGSTLLQILKSGFGEANIATMEILDSQKRSDVAYRSIKSSKGGSRKMAELQPQVEALGKEIFDKMEGDGVSIFNKDWWYGRIMDATMQSKHFKTQMFRFVDVLPYLNSGSEVARHLKEYFAEKGDQLPGIFNFGVGVGSLAPSLLAGAVRKNVTEMAKMFIVGENPEEAIPVLKKTRDKDLCFTVDILGEVALSEKEALDYQNRYIELIKWLAKESQGWESKPQIDTDAEGEIPKVNVSVKLSSLFSQIHNVKAWEYTKSVLKERMRPVFKTAMENNVFINIDVEDYAIKDITIEAFLELISEPEYKEYPHWGLALQAYLRECYADVEMLVGAAKKRKVPFTVRLVKGAYWDYELVKAKQNNWPIPVYTNKQESDENFERCARLMLDNYKYIRLALGSHNVRSIAATICYARKLGLPDNALELQMLHGMAEPIKNALKKMGFRVREYTPVGELIPGMAYFVRRLLENTSNESFLRSKFADNVSTVELMKDPADDLTRSTEKPDFGEEFVNEPLLDFAKQAERTRMEAALAKVGKSLGKTFPLVIGKKEYKTEKTITSVNPAHPDQVVGKVHLATQKEADMAIEAAKTALESWKRTAPEKRAEILDKVADIMARRRDELAALEVYEVAKPWSEADGDITESIDFCRYYADEMRRLGQWRKVGNVPGEDSHYHYVPRGVVLVISPWNFPLALLTGMLAGAVVTGNTTIVKPSGQSPIIAAFLMDIMKEAGVPAGVVNFLPGPGRDVGNYLVEHKDIAMITFTGSMEVGLDIIEKAAKVKKGQRSVKKVIAEMGGKNALIVDSDADLDEAVAGALYSAFGFQGQKCSACSRAIVHEDLYDRFVERLTEATRSIKATYPDNPEAYLGPVIDESAQKTILDAIERGKKEAKLAFQGDVPSEGYFVPPTIFVDVDQDSFLAQDEFFGPVLAVIKAKNLDNAIEIANNSLYGLTGGIYSRSPANIEKARHEVECGNFYINRQITAAMVNRHPFGGFKMSGVGSKTGGQDYLIQYMEPRVVTENSMRRGFTPDVIS